MKIILTHDVDRPGAVGDVVTVKDGYGRNHLISHGYAARWIRGGRKQIDQTVKARRRRATQSLDEASTIQEALQANVLKIVKPAGKNGRLLGFITNAEVAGAASAATGKKVDRRTIILIPPIKSTGSYRVAVKLHDDVVVTISIEVVAEKKKKKQLRRETPRMPQPFWRLVAAEHLLV